MKSRTLRQLIVTTTGCIALFTVIPIVSADSHFIRYEPNNTKVIVFVHGVLGDSVSTWVNTETRAYWPALLAVDKDFRDANVYVFDYPSPPFDRALSISELAENMRARLEADKVLAQHSELIFLSHSMGGLVTRAFLARNTIIAKKVKLAYFFATPTTGSPLALLTHVASKNPQFGAMRQLQPGNFLADSLQEWLNAKLPIRSFCAYETQPTSRVWVVSQESASTLCTEPPDPIGADHIQMVKPKDMQSDAYIVFKNAFKAVVLNVGKELPPSLQQKIIHLAPVQPGFHAEGPISRASAVKFNEYLPKLLRAKNLDVHEHTSVQKACQAAATTANSVAWTFRLFEPEVEPTYIRAFFLQPGGRSCSQGGDELNNEDAVTRIDNVGNRREAIPLNLYQLSECLAIYHADDTGFASCMVPKS